MKKITLLIALACIIQFTAFSQSCLPEGITFATQEEIDNFQSNYPYCTEIEGDVEIKDSDITNLIGLNVLTSIGGGLSITNNSSLTSLTGLENLLSVGGDLVIGVFSDWITHAVCNGNPLLIDINSLSNLTSITGNLHISCNESLTDLSGLDNVIFVGGDLRIISNDSLVSLLPLRGLDTIQGSLIVGINHHWGPFGNPSLANLSGLDNLDYIGRDLNIARNESLISLTGLENLNFMGGRQLDITANSNLVDLLGLYNMVADSITYLTIAENSSLSSCEAQSICNHLSSPEEKVKIFNNAPGCNSPGEVAFECGFPMPCLPDGDYYFTSQADIDNFPDHYPGCVDLEGDVIISGNDITNLNGLSIVSSIGGSLTVGRYSGGNALLTNLAGLEGITLIGGNLTIKHNDTLASLAGLNNLMYIEGDLFISGNDSLTSLIGLDNLSNIGGDLSISENNSLTSFAGLSNLSIIGRSLRINGNDALSNLIGLGSLYSIAGDLQVAYNPKLTNCDIEGICSYLSDPPGTIDIYGNAVGCSSLFEVSAACGTTLPCPEGRNYLLSSQFEVDHFSSVFGGCNELNFSLSISGAEITQLDSLSSITSIGGNLEIVDNNALASLTGLKNLTAIEGFLFLRNNDALSSLSGLENIEAGTIIDLGIVDNSQLSECEVHSICDYLANPNGVANFGNNAPGCNSEAEVDTACKYSFVGEISILKKLLIHPNPFNQTVTIEYELAKPETVTITFYNQFGKEVDIIRQDQSQGLQKVVWTPNNLVNGVYYFRLQLGEQMASGKVVLMR